METRATADPLIGDRLGDYLLLEEIGRGGMGVVYRALEEPLGRTVALKILAPSRSGHEEARRRFQREALSAAAIVHPNVLPVYRVDEAGDHAFITMQYVSGGSLAQVLAEQGPPPLATAVGIVAQVASGLDAAHEAGLVHRDVKPQNILIDASGHVWLTDFGTVRVTAEVASSLTRSGQMVGTIDYMSPEQIRGEAVGPSADVYGLACVAYRLLVGTVPFPRDDPVARMYAHLTEDPPDPSSMRSALPPEVGEVIRRGMAKDPHDRPQSAGAFASALGEACRDADATRDGAAPSGWGPTEPDDGDTTDIGDRPADVARARMPARPRPRMVLGAFAAAGIAIGAIGGYLAWSAGQPAAQSADGVTVVAAPAGLGVGSFGPVRWPYLLPSDWKAGSAPPRMATVNGDTRAIVWRGVRTRGGGQPADAVLIPTTAGTVGAQCTPSGPDCLAAAAGLALDSSVTPVAVRPSPDFARRVNSAGNRARRALDAAGASMAGATSTSAQAAAADALAKALGPVAAAIGPAPPGLAAPRSKLIGDIRRMQGAARGLAAAARASNSTAWASSGDALSGAARSFNTGVASLSKQGYRVER